MNTVMKNFAFGAAFLLLGQVSVALGAPSAAQLKREAFAVVDTNADRMGRLNDAIFSYSEIGFQEVKTIALVRKTLESAGFTVQTGVAGMPTAYMARYGSGSPVIGLMSDYDGIPGGSQKPTSLVHDPFVPGGPGHGDHHLSLERRQLLQPERWRQQPTATRAQQPARGRQRRQRERRGRERRGRERQRRPRAGLSRPAQPSWRRTSAATAPPSARPLVWPCTAPMTLPIARMPSSCTPSVAIVEATRSEISCAVSCSGR